MKTKKEIEDLKANWKADPCWDIEVTEGFEDHKEELKVFRLAHEAKREQSNLERDLEAAGELGLSLGKYNTYRRYINQRDNHSNTAKKLMKHYFSFSISNMDSDNRSEIDEIVDCIVKAAVEEVKAVMIKSNKKN